jgi:hypothetical protein
MIGARDLLDRLRAAGVRFGIEGDRLRVQGPATILTEPVYQQLLYFKGALRELIWTEPATSDLCPAAVMKEDALPERPSRAIEATFRSGVRVQVRSETPSRYGIWLRSERRWVRQRGASPSPDHARQIAEQWFGMPVNDWQTVEPEEAL